MLGIVRRTAFAVVGGFSMTTLFIDALSEAGAALTFTPHGDSSSGLALVNGSQFAGGGAKPWFFTQRKKPAAPSRPPRDTADNSLMDDVELLIQRHQLLSLCALVLCVTGGGFGAILGSLTAVAFDGEEGLERYYQVKDRLLDALDL